MLAKYKSGIPLEPYIRISLSHILSEFNGLYAIKEASDTINKVVIKLECFITILQHYYMLSSIRPGVSALGNSLDSISEKAFLRIISSIEPTGIQISECL